MNWMRIFDLIIPAVAGLAVLIIGALLVDIGASPAIKATLIALISAVLGGAAGAFAAFLVLNKHFHADFDPLAIQASGAMNEIRAEVRAAIGEFRESEERISKALHSIIASRMITDDYMAQLEKRCQCKDIWIVTPDLHKDVENPDGSVQFADIVFENIVTKKVQYTYLIPDEHAVVGRARVILSKYKGKNGQPQIFPLPPETWKTLPYTAGDYIIYNPTLSVNGDLTEGFVEVPSKTRDLWVKLAEPTLNEWTIRMERIIHAVRMDTKPIEAPKSSA